jgi:hypothetical protein
MFLFVTMLPQFIHGSDEKYSLLPFDICVFLMLSLKTFIPQGDANKAELSHGKR